MAKLALLAATLALFLLLANASIYRTSVEIDEVENPQRQCRREFEKHQGLRSCQKFMRRQAWSGSPSETEYTDDGSRRSFRQCCKDLENVDEECVCPLLNHAIQQQKMQGQLRGEQIRKLYSTARNLPDWCDIPVGTCHFGGGSSEF